jgi:hypothetical protein
MAGLKYGQYLSQYDVRAIAGKNKNNVQTTTQYLVGVNDQYAAEELRLNAIEYSSKDTSPENYLSWVKKMTRQGYAVTITVFMNYYQFYGITDPSAGDSEYDHIVSVSQIHSDYDDDEYHAGDVLTLEDHGLWAPIVSGPVYLFNYTFAEFPGTREEANARTGAIYTLPAFAPSSKLANYGIAHTGPVDTTVTTASTSTTGTASASVAKAAAAPTLLPVQVATSVNYEDPSIKKNSNTRPASMPLTLTVTVSGLEEQLSYNLYWYNDEQKVPTSNFNQNSAAAAHTFVVDGTGSGGSHTITASIVSSDKAFFRAVRADAP